MYTVSFDLASKIFHVILHVLFLFFSQEAEMHLVENSNTLESEELPQRVILGLQITTCRAVDRAATPHHEPTLHSDTNEKWTFSLLSF